MTYMRVPVYVGILALAALLLSWAALPVAARAEAIAVDSGYVDVPGGKIFYERSGTGESIVLIHDGLVHRVIWDNQFGVFARHYDVVRYDRRGYGKSPTPTASFSNVEDLLALMDGLKIQRAVVFGMSMGGGLAIDFALAHPDRVTALVLVGSIVSGMEYTPHMYTRGGHFTQADMATPEATLEYFAVKDPYEVSPKNPAIKERVKAILTTNPQDMNEENNRWATPPARPALPNLGEIKVPVLILAGEDDIPDVFMLAGAIAAGVPHARRAVILDAGHLVPFEQPEAFNREVLTFLADEPFFALLDRAGVAAAVARFEKARAADPTAMVFSENRMNLVAYRLLARGKVDDAIELFRLNARAYPQSFNVYDSLGEGYAARGDRKLAIENYRKSLELNPGNENAKKMLKDLEVEAGAAPKK